MIREKGLTLEEEDKKYLWHPYTQMADYLKEKPLVIEEGKGVRLKDTEGRWYLDGVSSLWVNVHGHGRPEIDSAIEAQLRKVAHSTLLGLANVPAVRLARRLVEIAPRGLTKVFYSDNGSTAVEVALKMSYQFWQQGLKEFRKKKKFVSFKNAYHGDTLGCMAVGGIPLFHEIFKPLAFTPRWAESPYCYRCPLGLALPECRLECLKGLEEMLSEHSQEIAGLIIEPRVQAAAGMIVQPHGFLKRVGKLCSYYRVHLIADEVAVGFGRTGTMFACEAEEVKPDFLCLAKGITGGYLPLAATLTTEEVFQGFLSSSQVSKTFYHGHTYTGNPLACAAALANLELFAAESTLEKLKEKIKFLKGALAKFYELAHVGDIRQAGLMVGIELVEDKTEKRPYASQKEIGHKVILESRSRGLIIRPLGDVIVLMPPLAISLPELREMVEIAYESIRVVTEG